MRRPNVVHGGALLTALFIMTLVAIIATAMSVRLQLDIYRTRLIINHDKLVLASQALTFWALNELKNENNHFRKINSEGMIAIYPKNMETIYKQVRISGGLYDLQARFNLNNLVDNKSTYHFLNLLSHTYPQINSKDSAGLTLSIKDWLSAYDLSRGKDSFITYYLEQKPPYYPSHQLMKSSSELRLVKDVSASAYLALEPFITVLPESTPININTASKQVMMSLGHGLTETQTNELMMQRGDKGIKDIKEISELLKKFDLPGEQITLESHYFLSVAYLRSDDLNLVFYTYFKRSRDNNKKLTVSILRESMNGF